MLFKCCRRSSPKDTVWIKPKDRLIRNWVQSDPVAAVDWIVENPENKNIRPAMLSIALPRLVLVDPFRALEIALEQPFDYSLYIGGGLESSLIETLAENGRFDEARAMLKDVREPLQRRSYYTLGLKLLDFDKPDEVIGLIQDRPESEQFSYFSALTVPWLTTNPTQLVDYIDRLPSQGTTNCNR